MDYLVTYRVTYTSCLVKAKKTKRPVKLKRQKRNENLKGWKILINLSIFIKFYLLYFIEQIHRNMRQTRSNFKVSKRKCTNAAMAIKRDKFVNACLQGDKDMFKEL